MNIFFLAISICSFKHNKNVWPWNFVLLGERYCVCMDGGMSTWTHTHAQIHLSVCTWKNVTASLLTHTSTGTHIHSHTTNTKVYTHGCKQKHYLCKNKSKSTYLSTWQKTCDGYLLRTDLATTKWSTDMWSEPVSSDFLLGVFTRILLLHVLHEHRCLLVNRREKLCM